MGYGSVGKGIKDFDSIGEYRAFIVVAKRKAVVMYYEGYSLREIIDEVGISHQQAHAAIKIEVGVLPGIDDRIGEVSLKHIADVLGLKYSEAREALESGLEKIRGSLL